MNFAEWRETSMCLLFSAEELNLDVYGSAYEALSLSISFQAGKVGSDIASTIDLRQIGVQNAQAGANLPITRGLLRTSESTPRYCARLVMMQATEVSLQEGSCDKRQVYYPAGVAKAYVQTQKDAQRAVHATPKSQLQNY